ncbi:hypothetical protein JYQ62_09600 [Nostoc sp. UHCC 0702]|nr:hypothetical protein JYQ62_09600 [Nostoc sp. UHCC 0702]
MWVRCLYHRPRTWCYGHGRPSRATPRRPGDRCYLYFAKGYDFVTPAADAWLLSDAARSVVTGMKG